MPIRALRSAFTYPIWRPVLRSDEAMALDLNLVPEKDLPEVKQIARGRDRSR